MNRYAFLATTTLSLRNCIGKDSDDINHPVIIVYSILCKLVLWTLRNAFLDFVWVDQTTTFCIPVFRCLLGKLSTCRWIDVAWIWLIILLLDDINKWTFVSAKHFFLFQYFFLEIFKAFVVDVGRFSSYFNFDHNFNNLHGILKLKNRAMFFCTFSWWKFHLDVFGKIASIPSDIIECPIMC